VCVWLQMAFPSAVTTYILQNEQTKIRAAH
jgi:hypothetical protein